MKRCEQGPYFDPAKHSACPACGVSGLKLGETKPKPKTDDEPPPLPAGDTRPMGEGPGDGATVAVGMKEMGFDPVVGWLVCIDGADRGRDYRIRSEKNFIGRSDKMDICIKGDNAISREKHASISHNPRNGTFRLQPGEGRGLVYLNGEETGIPTELKAHDIIELGQTKLMFVPLCGENFKW